MVRNFKNILIIKPSAIGDIAQSLPVLSAIRGSFADAKISWMVRKEFADMLRGHPMLDDIIIFDRKRLGKFYRNPKICGELWEFLKDLRERRFDLVIDLQGLFRTGFFSWMTGAEYRYGKANAREFGHIFYSHRIKKDKSHIHILDYYLRIVKAAGAFVSNPEFILPDTNDVLPDVRRIFTEGGFDFDRYAVIVAGSAHNDKCWSAERFAKTSDILAERYGLDIVAVGSKSESAKTEKIAELSKTKILNLAGKTNLRQLMCVLRNTRIAISNDTGPGHIAAASGSKVVMIFGRSNPSRVRPYYQVNSVAAIDADKRGTRANSYKKQYSIKNISVDMVLDKIQKQLSD
jgi:heptosyltransferase-1